MYYLNPLNIFGEVAGFYKENVRDFKAYKSNWFEWSL